MYKCFEMFVDYWCSIRAGDTVPHRTAFNPGRVVPFLQRMMIVERSEDGAFLVRLVGTELEDRLGHCPVGTPFSSLFGHQSLSLYGGIEFVQEVSALAGHAIALSPATPDGSLDDDLVALLTHPAGILGQRRAHTVTEETVTCRFLILPLRDRCGDVTKFIFLTDFTPHVNALGVQSIRKFGAIEDLEMIDLGNSVPQRFVQYGRRAIDTASPPAAPVLHA